MSDRVSEAAYKKAFLRKVKLAREGAGYSAAEMAKALGITKDKYYRYESRHLMRHDLIPLFCHLTKTDIEKLMAQPIPPSRRRSAA